ncbi:MAG: SDR family oxidoreductase, partial [Desulfovibrio sp.]
MARLKVLVTGANGFVGRAVLDALAQAGHDPVAAVRGPEAAASLAHANLPVHEVGSVDGNTEWVPVLQDVDAVIHLAARVHVMQDTAASPLDAFRLVNREGTLNLARQAFASGVTRLVYASTIKVHGEATPDAPFSESSPLAGKDPYAVSKIEAEQGLFTLAQDAGREAVVLRPPLVYGPGVSANFLRMLKLVDKGLPLPLGLVRNKRSLIGLANLAHALVHCVDHPQAANRAYVVSDGQDLSTPELIRALASAMGKPARLLPFPPVLLRLAGKLLGKSHVISRLLGSLAVDSSTIRAELGWSPPQSLEQGLRLT